MHELTTPPRQKSRSKISRQGFRRDPPSVSTTGPSRRHMFGSPRASATRRPPPTTLGLSTLSCRLSKAPAGPNPTLVPPPTAATRVEVPVTAVAVATFHSGPPRRSTPRRDVAVPESRSPHTRAPSRFTHTPRTHARTQTHTLTPSPTLAQTHTPRLLLVLDLPTPRPPSSEARGPTRKRAREPCSKYGVLGIAGEVSHGPYALQLHCGTLRCSGRRREGTGSAKAHTLPPTHTSTRARARAQGAGQRAGVLPLRRRAGRGRTPEEKNVALASGPARRRPPTSPDGCPVRPGGSTVRAHLISTSSRRPRGGSDGAPCLGPAPPIPSPVEKAFPSEAVGRRLVEVTGPSATSSADRGRASAGLHVDVKGERIQDFDKCNEARRRGSD